MLYVDKDLPEGCLLNQHSTGDSPEVTHLVADATGVIVADGAVAGWRDTHDKETARLAKPNLGHANTGTENGVPVLRFRDGENCGFALDDVMLACPVFSMAMLFASPAEGAGTLLTLNPKDGRNYLFLGETAGEVSLKYRDGDDQVVQPMTTAGGFHLVCASINHQTMNIAVDDGAVCRKQVSAQSAAGAYDVFIGCRSDRSGIAKTLGEMHLAEVWIWPDRDVFADDSRSTLVDHWREVNAHAV